MSAAPAQSPGPEPPAPATEAGAADAGADDQGWALLENLRRRLEDQAAQTRRTQQQVAQLAESIGALVEVQQRRARGLNLNSFIAYLIFTMLCGAGFYALYRSRAEALVDARDAAHHERDQAVRRADEAGAKAAARAAADDRAWEVYQLLESGKRADASAKLAALRDLPLSRTERALLAARAHETQVMAVEAAVKAAGASFKAGRHGEVIAPLEAALVSEPTGDRAVLMRYYLGVAYAKANQLERAIAHLQAAVDGNTDQDDARFQLASALDRSGAYARARAEYDQFATAHPQSGLAVFAMRRSATLARMPPAAPAPNPAAPGAAPGGWRPPATPGAAPAPPGWRPPAPTGAAPTGAAPPSPAPTGAAPPPAPTGAPPAGAARPPAAPLAPGGVPSTGGWQPPAPSSPPPAPPAPPKPAAPAGAGSAAAPPAVAPPP